MVCRTKSNQVPYKWSAVQKVMKFPTNGLQYKNQPKSPNNGLAQPNQTAKEVIVLLVT